MRNTNKKGFTIVELVVVVAVIAILAAVLIPTVSGIIKKANIASDTAVAKNMNAALAEYTAENGEPESFTEVLNAIEKYGFVISSLNAKANGNLYAWDKENNQIVYLDSEFKAIYQNVDFDFDDLCFVVADSSVQLPDGSESVALTADPTYLKNALAAGGDIAIADDIKVTGETATDKNFVAADNAVVNFGDNNIVLDMSGEGANYSGLWIEDASNVVINGKNGGITVANDQKDNMELYGIVLENANGADPITVTISGGKYAVGGQVVYARGYNITVNITGGYFESFNEDNVYYGGICPVLNAKNGANNKFVLSGGTFVNFDISEDGLADTCAKLGNDVITIADGYKVVEEAHGTDTWYIVVPK